MNAHFFFLFSLIIFNSIFCQNNFEISEVQEEWDPFQLVSYVKTNGLDHQFIDPNGYLEDESEINSIKEKLATLKNLGVNTVFIIIKKLNADYALTRTGLKFFLNEFEYYYTKEFNENKESLLFICYTIEDERSLFRIGEKIEDNLSEDEANKIQARQLSKVRDELYGKVINNVLKDTIYYMDKCDDCVTFWVGIGFFIFAGAAIVVLLIIQLIICIRGKQISDEEKRKVNLMSAFLSNYKTNRNVVDEVCILCLHSILPKTREANKYNQLNDSNSIDLNPPKKQKCGHSFHQKCLEDWILLEDDICPLCIEKIDKEDTVEKMQKKLVDIQSRLHKVFNELNFRFENNKLKYKFSSDFHSGDLTQLN